MSNHDELGAHLSAMLSDHADDFEPSPDSYIRLAARVSDSQRRSSRRWAGGGMLAVAAASLAVAAGIGLINMGEGVRSESVTPAAPEPATSAVSVSSAPSQVSEPKSGNEVESESGNEVESEVSEPVELEIRPDLGPARPTQDAAAKAFLDHVGIRFVGFEKLSETMLEVKTFLPGTDRLGETVTTLTLVEVGLGGSGNGWAVERAESDLVSIESPTDSEVNQEKVAVSGTVINEFDDGPMVRFRSVLDGSVLAQKRALVAGTGEAQPFSVELESGGISDAWLVAEGETISGSDAFPISAVPIRLVAGSDSNEYGVVRGGGDTGDDGSEAGLVVRASASLEGEPITVLPVGTVEIKIKAGVLPVRADDIIWRPIVTPDGLEGWANSAFLASRARVETANLVNESASLAKYASGLSSESGGAWPSFSQRMPITIGWVGADLSAPEQKWLRRDLGNTGAWFEDRDFAVPEGIPSPTGLRDFLSLPNPDDNGVVIEAGDGQFPFEIDGEVAKKFFGGLSYSTITWPGATPEDSPNRAYLFFERGRGGSPELVGIVRSYWRP